MKAAILALIIGSLVLGGLASAQPTFAPIVPLDQWLNWAHLNLSTPAYTSGWGFAFANATAVDPCTGLCVPELKPYALTAVVISPDTKAINEAPRVHGGDPSALLNLTVQSVAALGNGTITTAAVREGTQDFAAYSAAVGSADIEAVGIHRAETIGAFNTTALVNTDVAISQVSGFASALADHAVV